MRTKIFLFVVAVIFLNSCQQAADQKLGTTYLDLPQTPYSYSADTSNNLIPTLGRVLFYDTRLSANNSVSCATCHKQAFAFSDNVQFSRGFAGQLTGRNAMPIQNLAQNTNVGFIDDDLTITVGDSGFSSFGPHTLFWDGRETLVEAQVLRPITNHVEMGMTIDELTTKLAQLPEYKSLFENAFGSDEITQGKVGVAIAKFISSISSNQSKFDKYTQGQIQLTAAEEIGRGLFFNKYNCNSCHQVTILNGYQEGGGFVDIGLDMIPTDQGRFDVTGNSSDMGKFKIPTLRNVALTAPYMHDGRFNTLDEVLNHYSTEILNSKNLDIRLQENGAPKQFLISDQDKQNLIAFLNTLTDYQMITDPKFSSPFKVK